MSGAFCSADFAGRNAKSITEKELKEWFGIFAELTQGLSDDDRLAVAVAFCHLLLRMPGQAGYQVVLAAYLVAGSVDTAFTMVKRVKALVTAGRPRGGSKKSHAEVGPKVVNSENRVTTLDGFRGVWTELFGGDIQKVTSEMPRKKLESIAKEHGILASGKVGELVDKINRHLSVKPLLQRILDTPHEYRVPPNVVGSRAVDEFDF